MSAAVHSQGSETAELRLRVAVFNLLPAAYVHPERLADFLPAGLSRHLQQELLNCRRLRYRLSQRILAAFCSEVCDVAPFSTPERQIALRGRTAIARLARLAGASWHGGFLRTVIDGAALREVLERIGAEACDFALARLDQNAPLCGEIALDDLRQVVDRDGIGCLKAWSAAQPKGLRERISLMISPVEWGDGTPEPKHQARGPGIVREAALELQRHD